MINYQDMLKKILQYYETRYMEVDVKNCPMKDIDFLDSLGLFFTYKNVDYGETELRYDIHFPLNDREKNLKIMRQYVDPPWAGKSLTINFKEVKK